VDDLTGNNPMSPKVSICIPTYNRKDYLKETLDSVFAQIYTDYEVVIVDDGSTDGTEEMIKNSSYKLRYHKQPNAGDASARNKLIELAEGKYITFIDSDDLLMPDAVFRLVEAEESAGGDVVVYGPYYRIDQDGKIYGKCKRKLCSGFIANELFQNILVHSCGSLFPKKILKESGGFDSSMRRCSVYKFLLQLSLKYKFIAVNEPVFKRRRHMENIGDNSFEKRKAELDVIENFYYNQGGNKVIPKHAADKRISKEYYRAARCALNEKKYQTALQLFRQSFRQHPNIKSFIHLIRTKIAYKLSR